MKLSICIPTYNFGRFIEETLNTILPQLTQDIELVIFDSNSQDQTEAICHNHIAQNPKLNIRYIKSPAKQGIDRDIESAVQQALGEYIWLFSADDLMRPGCLAMILDQLKSRHDVYICEHFMCDFNFKNGSPHPVFNNIKPLSEFDFSNEKSKKKFFSKARTSEAFFSFLSTPIFKKSFWNRIPVLPEAFYTTHWGLAGRLLLASKEGMKVRYLGTQLLLKRGENDSFATQGEIHRIGISIKGFNLLADSIFGHKSHEAFHIRRVLISEFPVRPLIMLKFKAYKDGRFKDIKLLNELIKILFSDFTPLIIAKKIMYHCATGWLLYRTYRILRFLKHDVLRKYLIRARS